MSLSSAKLSEFSLHTSVPLFLPRRSLQTFRIFFTSIRTHNGNPNAESQRNHSNRTRYPWDEQSSNTRKSSITRQKSRNSSSPWIKKWPSSNTGNSRMETQKKPRKAAELNRDSANPDNVETRYFDEEKRPGSIERIIYRLKNLGFGVEDQDDDTDMNSDLPWEGEEKLGDLLQRTWKRPDTLVVDHEDSALLPWERGDEVANIEDEKGVKKRFKAPTLAELTIEDLELRRLRKLGITLRERITIPKAGVTQEVLDKIHAAWRKSELARLKFHETLAHDMKTAHEIVERRTGGLVIWRAGSVMVVYRGSTYKRPSSRSQNSDIEGISSTVLHEGDRLIVPDISPIDNNEVSTKEETKISTALEKIRPQSIVTPDHDENLTEEEREYNNLLDGLGPRFVEWWGTGVLPIDADLLPQQIPGYKTPFRLLPTGMRPRLTNAEMTNLRKLTRSLPCHFALGRNRNHQGLAAAILKLWEKSLVVKIAVKRGIQNTNNKIMAEELKNLTGGILLLRNKYYIVIYRGKDFISPTVAKALAERQELARDIQDIEEKARTKEIMSNHSKSLEGVALAGTLAEFHEAQTRWGKQVSSEELKKMKEEASRAKSARIVKRIEHKLSLAQSKKLRAETLLSKIEASMIPIGPSDDQETITDEERFMFRRVGLRMKSYLPLGIRGVFDGVIENMHLHWKHRELVKLISKQKTLAFVEETARLIEYESGGILVAIERVPKGYALIYYRGKNYRRPINLRPRNLLTKAKALKRSVAMQRHEALSQHISELEKTIAQMKSDIGDPMDESEIASSSQDEPCYNYLLSNSKRGDKDAVLDDIEDGNNTYANLEDNDYDSYDDDTDSDDEWNNEDD